MRFFTSILVSVPLTLAMTVSFTGCAGKRSVPKHTSEELTTPAPVQPPAEPPKNLALKVDVTPPKDAPKPPPPPPPPPPPVDPCGALRSRLSSSPVHFAVDRDNIEQSAVSEVDAINSMIRASGLGTSTELSVEGHCDSTGSEGYNLALSERRARTVVDRLVALGAISAGQAKIIPWGEQRPLDPEETPDAYAKNRRVEIVLHCAQR